VADPTTPRKPGRPRKVQAPAPKTAPAKAPAMLTAAQALDAVSSSLEPAAAKPVAAPRPARKAPVAPETKPVAKPVAAAVAEVPPAEPTPLPEPAVAEVAKPTPSVTKVTVPPAPEETPAERVVPLPKAEDVAEGKLMMTDVIETTKKFAEDTKAKLETAFSEFNEKAKANVEKSTKALEELSALAKGNVEALVESGKIAAKGVEALGQDAAEYSRKNFEKATATFKSFASVKTPAEFFQLQSELLSSSFDAFAKESAKSSEALLKLAGDVVQPISSRVSIVTDKVKSLAA
jgi:phasin family protein